MSSVLQQKPDFGELARFLVVGLSAVAVDFCVYFAIIHFSPAFSTSIAKAISFVSGAFVSFLANRGFVFRSDGRASRQVGPFAILYLISLAANNAVNAVVLAVTTLKLFAWLCATGTSTITNFLGMKFIVFKKNEKALEGSTS